MVAVALLAANTEDGGRAAFEAGCEGFISKPLDPLELADRVREHLNPQSAVTPTGPDLGDFSGAVTLSGPEAEDLRRSFAADGARQSRAMVNSLGGTFDELQAHLATHDWAGTAHVLGFEDISQRARAVAQILGSYPCDKSKLQIALTNMMNAFLRAAARAETPLPETVARRVRGKHIAMVGFAEREAERLCEALERAGALGRLFGASQPPESEAVQDCALVLVHVRPETKATPWLKDAPRGSRPLVLVGRGEDLMALDPAVQDRAREFLIDGWQAEEVVMRLGLILSHAMEQGVARREAMRAEQPPAAPPAVPKSGEVLIVDDDLTIRALVRTLLQAQGIKCHLAANGAEGVAMISEYRPSLVVLDINMPGMNGFEVLAKVRAEMPTVRVVMLTAREQEADIVQGFALGADDYVVKPFNPQELVARVKRLL